MKKEKNVKRSENSLGRNYLLLIVTGTVINALGCTICMTFNLPMYLATIGTMLCSVLGGFFPSTIVAIFTNIIAAAFDANEIFFSLLNMVTAILCSAMSKKFFVQKSAKPLIMVPILSVTNGTIGAIMTWFLYGGIGGITEPIVMWVKESYGFNDFISLILGCVGVEFLDKFVTVIAVMLLYNFVPKNVIKMYTNTGIWQTSLSTDEETKVRKSEYRVLSIRTKLSIIIIGSVLLVSLFATIISLEMFKDSIIEQNTKLAEEITMLESDTIDADRVDRYIQFALNEDGYIETYQKLSSILHSHGNVKYVYVYRVLESGCQVVFDTDTEEVAMPGEMIPFDESFKEYVPALLAGEEIPPIISNDKYGWLLTVYKPVYDSTGRCVCYACCDISMDIVNEYFKSFMVKFLSLMTVVLILALSIAIWLTEYNIIHPLNAIAYATSEYAVETKKIFSGDFLSYNDANIQKEKVKVLKRLKITTGDEVEHLYNSILNTIQANMFCVYDIKEKTEMIVKMQSGLIRVIADMVESRDQSTGDHIRKTAAYVAAITGAMKKHGYYADEMTDDFIENVIYAAPLHDIGKIHIPDNILCKPGKLTDEEYEIMKTHTTVGGVMLEKVIKVAPNSGYIREARKMAEYHHEKWNGKGYPHGLRGEDIPLSARIMAVADVFDALVSERCYKKGMPFEKAIGIIQEERGKHFDPLVVDAFLSAETMVKNISNSISDSN